LGRDNCPSSVEALQKQRRSKQRDTCKALKKSKRISKNSQHWEQSSLGPKVIARATASEEEKDVTGRALVVGVGC